MLPLGLQGNFEQTGNHLSQNTNTAWNGNILLPEDSDDISV